jgi:hypothetical protein
VLDAVIAVIEPALGLSDNQGSAVLVPLLAFALKVVTGLAGPVMETVWARPGVK